MIVRLSENSYGFVDEEKLTLCSHWGVENVSTMHHNADADNSASLQ